jgi:hypothetical protein
VIPVIPQRSSRISGEEIPQNGDIDFGRELRIRFAAPVPRAILAYDWQDGTYRPLAPSL